MTWNPGLQCVTGVVAGHGARERRRKPMKVRGHHLCCSVCFLGSGKETAREYFGIDNAIPELAKKTMEAPETEIELTDTFDDVCTICPIKVDAGCGRGGPTEDGIREPGEGTTFARVYRRLAERIPDIGVVCTNCTSSKPYGFSTYRDGLRMLNARRARGEPGGGPAGEQGGRGRRDDGRA